MPKGKEKERDFAWKYVADNRRGQGRRNYVFCKFCGQRCMGGVTCLKHHLAATYNGIKACPKVTQEAKEECIKGLREYHDEKDKENDVFRDIGKGGSMYCSDFGNGRVGNDVFEIGSGSSGNQLIVRARGPMDQFVSSEQRHTEERKEVCRAIGRFFFGNALPFNLCNSPYFLDMCEAIGKFGQGLKPPSMYEMRTWILKEEVINIDNLMKPYKDSWKAYGCSIMADSWTDGKNKSIINFLINSRAGTVFYKSIDASDSIKDENLLFKYLDDIVEEIGEENVVQVITNNHLSHVNVEKKLMEKRRKIYWTPCAAYYIDLMLEDIGKIKMFSKTLEKARIVTEFIYGHGIVLSMMRNFTNNNELLRPAVTRFATAYLTLRSIYKQKNGLQAMFVSYQWYSCSWAKRPEGVKARAIIMFDPKFWPQVALCVKSIMPLVSVLREIESEERPAMGFFYELMMSVKEKIAWNCNNVERRYDPIWDKIDERWINQLHCPLHIAGYYLNPQIRYSDKFLTHPEIKKQLLECMDRMIPDRNERADVDIQLDEYDFRRGDFGSQLALDTVMRRSPADWWARFGDGTPQLTRFAIRVLSLTCIASGCERNWSTFEQVHSKRRNRLEQQKINSLVYVMYNMKLRERSMKRRATMDPILVDHIASDDEWIVEKEDPVLPSDPLWLEDQKMAFDISAIVAIPESDDLASSNAPSSSGSIPPCPPNPLPSFNKTYKRKATTHLSGHMGRFLAPVEEGDMGKIVHEVNDVDADADAVGAPLGRLLAPVAEEGDMGKTIHEVNNVDANADAAGGPLGQVLAPVAEEGDMGKTIHEVNDVDADADTDDERARHGDKMDEDEDDDDDDDDDDLLDDEYDL